MSRFNPTTRAILPDNEPDQLAGAVLDSLTRKLYYKLSWGPAVTLLASLVSFGFAPILAMVGWLRGLIAQHEQQLWHLAEWMRIQTGDPDVAELQKIAHEVRFSSALAVGSIASLLVAVFGAGMYLSNSPFDLREWYGFAFQPPQALASLLFTVGLSAGAACNWVHLGKHQQRVARFLRYFNEVAAEHDIAPIPVPRLELGTQPVWMVGGVLLALLGGIWGIPLMLAGGAHRRYTIGTSVLIRSMLAERLRGVLAARRPAVRIPSPLIAARRCVRPNCRAALSSVATFCPRCGTRAARLMNVVA